MIVSTKPPREYIIELMNQMFLIDKYEEPTDYEFDCVRWLKEEREYRKNKKPNLYEGNI